jgi:hypothetical protein
MTVPLLSAVEKADAIRWREWQVNNDADSDKGHAVHASCSR